MGLVVSAVGTWMQIVAQSLLDPRLSLRARLRFAFPGVSVFSVRVDRRRLSRPS